MISCLHHLIFDAAIKWPKRIAMIEPGRENITYGQLNEKVNLLSHQILKIGLRKGERVGILSRNSIASVAVYFAISRAGGVVVPLNYTLDPLDILERTRDCAISAIYVGKGLELKARKVIDKTRSTRFVIEEIKEEKGLGAKKFPIVLENDLASIVYTSGTTRRPLGVMLSHKNLISNTKSIVEYMNLKAKDRICCVLPFYYIYGLSLLLSHFLVGGAVIIDNRFMYPEAVLDAIDEYKATGFAGVSSHYAILLYKSNFAKRALRSLKYFMQAGDSMPQNITLKLITIFPNKKLYVMYGQTEASPRLTFLNPDLVKTKPNSIGRAIPGVRVKLINEKGKSCRAYEEGEITARGDNIMLEYWNNHRETKKVLKDGWLYTGDIAYKDKDGDLFIVGRKKNLMKIGGHRINPLEIERLIMEHGSVMEAAVVSVKDPLLGEKTRLFASSMPGKKIDKEDIMKFCKRRLPSYKVPREVVIVDSLPKNSLGKIDREALAAGYKEGAG